MNVQIYRVIYKVWLFPSLPDKNNIHHMGISFPSSLELPSISISCQTSYIHVQAMGISRQTCYIHSKSTSWQTSYIQDMGISRQTSYIQSMSISWQITKVYTRYGYFPDRLELYANYWYFILCTLHVVIYRTELTRRNIMCITLV